MNMNAAEYTDVIRRAEPFELPLIEEAEASRPTARDKMYVRLAYLLLAGFALFTVWYALTINQALDKINEQLDMPSPTYTCPVAK
jgi:hypothetical protein